MLSVMGVVAQFERTVIQERQREGIALEKQRGVHRGRRRSLHPEQIEEVRKRVEAGEAKARNAGECGISRQSLYRLLREYEPRHEC
jgi:DNA invertase Pin-like site-specific DNA recombinase